MNHRSTQFGVRENTASSRRHASHLTVDSLPSMSEALPGGLQHRQPTPVWASHASEPDKSVIAMPQEAATTGERGNSDETFSAPATVITAKVSRQVPVIPEPFASADEAAQFLCVKLGIFDVAWARGGLERPIIKGSLPPSGRTLRCGGRQGSSLRFDHFAARTKRASLTAILAAGLGSS